MGGSGLDSQKTAWTTFFLLFFSPQFIFTVYSGDTMVLLQRKLYFSKDLGGPKLFPEWGGGGVQMLISIESHITCDFPGGSGPLSPPLDPHMVSSLDNSTSLHV